MGHMHNMAKFHRSVVRRNVNIKVSVKHKDSAALQLMNVVIWLYTNVLVAYTTADSVPLSL